MDQEQDVNPVAVQEYLSGVVYPAQKNELVEKALSQEAPEEIINALNRLPEQEYASPASVSEELGKVM